MKRDDTHRPTLATRRQFMSDAAVLGLTVAASGLSSCSGSVNAQSAHRGRLRLAVNVGGTGDTLDPAKGATVIDDSRLYGIYDCMTRYDENNIPRPHLAREWSASPDRKSWTFRLQQNATWHDGRPVTADDVVFTFNRNLDPKVGATCSNTLTPL